MAKEPLSPTGVSDKLDEIYAVTTPNRLAEAAAVESNWKAWIGDNFKLTTQQDTFLSGISATANANFGCNSGLCFRNMLEIALVTSRSFDEMDKTNQ